MLMEKRLDIKKKKSLIDVCAHAWQAGIYSKSAETVSNLQLDCGESGDVV